jgi:hypothetical protein
MVRADLEAEVDARLCTDGDTRRQHLRGARESLHHHGVRSLQQEDRCGPDGGSGLGTKDWCRDDEAEQ